MGWLTDDIVSIWNAFYVGQKTATTCWKAGYEMMIRYKAGDPKKCDSLPNHDKMCERGILDSEFSACGQHIGLVGIKYEWFKDFNNLVHCLTYYGPIWCSGFFLDGKKHIIVIKGANIDDKLIEYNDPWRAYKGAQAKSSWASHGWFCNKVNPVPWACQIWK